MRHKYQTRALVLTRTPLGETSALLTLLTSDFGLLRARVQGVRKPGAKLAHALATLSESEVMLVKGSEGWRVTGASLFEQWQKKLSHETRLRVGRIAHLLFRLAPTEASERRLFPIFSGFLEALPGSAEAVQDAAECLAALRILSVLGLDAGNVPGSASSHYGADTLADVIRDRSQFITRINRGISASGL